MREDSIFLEKKDSLDSVNLLNKYLQVVNLVHARQDTGPGMSKCSHDPRRLSRFKILCAGAST